MRQFFFFHGFEAHFAHFGAQSYEPRDWRAKQTLFYHPFFKVMSFKFYTPAFPGPVPWSTSDSFLPWHRGTSPAVGPKTGRGKQGAWQAYRTKPQDFCRRAKIKKKGGGAEAFILLKPEAGEQKKIENEME
jgi:hypothetical protein